MTFEPRQIADLEEIVRVAIEEFDEVIACYEIWRPMVVDGHLHKRLGRSRATNAFRTLRGAMRREVLLGLTKLWDTDQRSVSLPRMIKGLNSPEIVDFFAEKCAAQWGELPINFGDDLPEEKRIELRKLSEEGERKFGRDQAAKLRGSVLEALGILEGYHVGDKKEVLDHLRHLRNKHIAHRDLNPPPSKADPASQDDEAVEQFYQDMSRCIHLLVGIVNNCDYRPDETAELRRTYASLLWRGLRGENTRGHPDYRPLRKRSLRKKPTS